MCVTDRKIATSFDVTQISEHLRYHKRRVEKNRKNKLNFSFGFDETTLTSINNFRAPTHPYFQHQLKNFGGKYLTAISQFDTAQVAKYLLKMETNFVLNLTYLLSGMSNSRQEMLIDLFKNYDTIKENKEKLLDEATKRQKLGDDEYEIPDMSWHVSIPKSYKELRNKYLYGKNSVMKNIPRPVFMLLSDGQHSCVPLNIILHCAYGHGFFLI